MKLAGRVALVTGASQGIGHACALALAREGATIAAAARNREKLDELVAAIAAAGGQAAAFVIDVADEDQIKSGVKQALAQFGKIDILVNNAGYTIDAPVHKMSDEQFQAMLDIHTVVPFRMCRAVAPHMREPAKVERDQGVEVFRKIVNVSSVSGTMGNAGQANYASGKSGVVGLTKTLAKEWGQFKINVNAVAFGYIETRLTADKDASNTMEIDGEKVQLGIPSQLRALAPNLIPLGRPGSPAEAAGGVFLLCTPWANYITGQVLNITGGQWGGMMS